MVFDPNMLAHGALVTSDVAAAFFFTSRSLECLATVSPCHVADTDSGSAQCLRFVPNENVRAVLFDHGRCSWSSPDLVKGTYRAGASRTRSGPRLRKLPRSPRSQSSELSSVPSLFLSIWAAFGFRYSALAEEGQPRDILNARWDFLLGDTGATGSVLKFVRDHHILPEAFVYGVAYVTKNSQSRPSFLDEHWSNVGFRSFFLKAFLYKTPLPLIALLGLGVARWRSWSFVRWRERKDADVQSPILRPDSTCSSFRDHRRLRGVRVVDETQHRPPTPASFVSRDFYFVRLLRLVL